MKDSKLVRSMKEMSAWELRHFHDFVHSPFFNKHPKVRLLVDHLLEFAPEFSGEKLEKMWVYEVLFPGQEFEEQKFKDILSLTMKQFRSFLAFYQLKNNDFRTGMALLEGYRERLQDKAFEKQQKGMLRATGNLQEKMQEVHLRRLELHEAMLTYQSVVMGRAVDNVVQVASDQLDIYFLVSKMRYGVEMMNRQQVVAQEFDPGLLEPVVAYLQDHPQILEKHPEIHIFLLIYRCLGPEGPDAHFEQLMDHLQRYGPGFPRPEVREMYAYVNNICIRQINRGKAEYLGTLMELYKWALAHDVLLSKDGWLVEWDYKNIVSASLRTGEVDWCRDFIERYKERMAPEARENAYTYNLASFYFEQGDYSRALKMLQTVEFRDVFYVLGSKVILLKAWYESGDHDALGHLLDSFRIYIKRNRTLSDLQSRIYLNLIRFARKLSDLDKKREWIGREELEKRSEVLGEKLAAEPQTAQARWLKQKILELA